MRNKRVAIAAVVTPLFGGAVMLAQQNGWFDWFPDWGIALFFIASAWLALLWIVLSGSVGDWVKSYKKSAMVTFIVIGAIVGAGTGWLLYWSTQRAKHVSAAQPNFQVEVIQAGAHFDAEDKETLIVLGLRVINKGAEGTIFGHRAHYKSPSLEQRDILIHWFTKPITLGMPTGVTLTLDGSHFIFRDPNKPIPQGRFISGRLAFKLPGDHEEDVIGGKALITVEVEDYLGNWYSGSITGTGKATEAIFLPGEIEKENQPLNRPQLSAQIRHVSVFTAKDKLALAIFLTIHNQGAESIAELFRVVIITDRGRERDGQIVIPREDIKLQDGSILRRDDAIYGKRALIPITKTIPKVGIVFSILPKELTLETVTNGRTLCRVSFVDSYGSVVHPAKTGHLI